jgi:predicted amidohydrolase YtcJ
MLRSISALLLCAAPAFGSDVTVLTAGRVHTMDPQRPVAEALAWDAGGRLLAVGSRDEVAASFPGAARMNVGDATVIPGLIDAHAHVMGLGLALVRADLVGTVDKRAILERLQEFERTLPAGAWLLGRGWDQNDWPDTAYPTAADLDRVFPERPVWLERIDGHAGWANSAAMRAAGRDLTGDWQPDGGRVLRAQHRPTGIFIDTAVSLIEAVVPPPDTALRETALRRALAAVAAAGLTGLHDMGTSIDDLALYRRLADDDRLSVRITAYADGDGAALATLCADGPYAHPKGRLRMAGVKLFADGALGSRGAALLADYRDEPGNRGLFVTPPAALKAAMSKALNCNLQLATHAIGDAANRFVLDLYERELLPAERIRLRWRIEHAQIVAASDIPRFAELHVIASMQPVHATSDGPWVEARIGQAGLPGAYAWRRFLDAGAVLAFGSDAPVESVDARLGLHAAVTREDLDGKPPGGWLPDQKLTLAEALRAFTQGAAYAGFAENDVGQLSKGMRADFVVLDADPFAVAPGAIPRLGVRSTWVDGRRVHEQPAAGSPPMP